MTRSLWFINKKSIFSKGPEETKQSWRLPERREKSFASRLIKCLMAACARVMWKLSRENSRRINDKVRPTKPQHPSPKAESEMKSLSNWFICFNFRDGFFFVRVSHSINEVPRWVQQSILISPALRYVNGSIMKRVTIQYWLPGARWIKIPISIGSHDVFVVYEDRAKPSSSSLLITFNYSRRNALI